MGVRRTNTTIGTKRAPAYNAVTKQTAAPAVYLTGIPAMVEDAAKVTQAGTLAAEYDLCFVVDLSADIVGGDQITGYNPSGQSPAPILVVGHVEYDKTPTGALDARTLWVKVLGGISP